MPSTSDRFDQRQERKRDTKPDGSDAGLALELEQVDLLDLCAIRNRRDGLSLIIEL